MKYHRQEALRRRLAVLLAAAVRARAENLRNLVLSVPMHWRRRLLRGYDHARVLAKAMAGELRLPLGHELVRTRYTPPQAHLPKSRRLENVRGSFAVRGTVATGGARGPATLFGAHVLLVDDVTTTGATADEAARVLLRAGTSSVTLAVIAKSEPPRAYAEQTVNP